MESNGVSSGLIIGIYLLMFAIWVALGYWGGKLAMSRGYSFWLGFAIGFFGGLIGIIILYVIPDRRAADYYTLYPPHQVHQRPPSTQNTLSERALVARSHRRNKVCPQCTNLIPADSQSCGYCGRGASRKSA
jgi:hypothetical protein